MTHEQAAAEMVIESIRAQIELVNNLGSDNQALLIDSLLGSLDVYDASRKKMKESDERLSEKMMEVSNV